MSIFKSRFHNRWLAALLTIIVTLLACYTVAYCARYSDDEIYFSAEETFHTKDVKLTLSTFLQNADLYYTLDGSTPTRESTPYTGKILLKAEEVTTCYPVRVVAYYRDGSVSEVCTRTYFVGKDADTRFTTMVVSINGENEDLYGYTDGILIPGKLRDDYVIENPEGPIDDTAPANYNLHGMESERVVYAEMWEPGASTSLISQQLGIRVHGGLSRGSDVKSLRLIAREEYGQKRMLSPLASITESQGTDTENVENDQTEPSLLKRVILRNSGNDQEWGYVRSELAAALAEEAGLAGVLSFRPAAVYINGEYYGFEWIEEFYDETWLEQEFGTDEQKGEWQIARPYQEESELAEAQADEDEDKEEAIRDLAEVLSYSKKDLTDDAVFAELCSRLDIDNFLQYCALELYYGNIDWPYNNCRAYRWYADNEDYSGEYTDGRWRFLIYDLDMSMARTEDCDADEPSLGYATGAVEDDWAVSAPLLTAVLKRDDMRNRFTELMNTYMDTVFAPDHVNEVIDNLVDLMETEVEYQLMALAEKDAEKSGEDVQGIYESYLGIHQISLGQLRDFFAQRPAVMQDELEKLEEYVENANPRAAEVTRKSHS